MIRERAVPVGSRDNRLPVKLVGQSCNAHATEGRVQTNTVVWQVHREVALRGDSVGASMFERARVTVLVVSNACSSRSVRLHVGCSRPTADACWGSTGRRSIAAIGPDESMHVRNCVNSCPHWI